MPLNGYDVQIVTETGGSEYQQRKIDKLIEQGYKYKEQIGYGSGYTSIVMVLEPEYDYEVCTKELANQRFKEGWTYEDSTSTSRMNNGGTIAYVIVKRPKEFHTCPPIPPAPDPIIKEVEVIKTEYKTKKDPEDVRLIHLVDFLVQGKDDGLLTGLEVALTLSEYKAMDKVEQSLYIMRLEQVCREELKRRKENEDKKLFPKG